MTRALAGALPRYRGALLGLAAGDALGTTLEFTTPGSFTPIADMAGGAPFDLAPGQWTDDTSMALCLAESLLECGEFDPHDQLSRYVRWKRDGHHSSTGVCFDVGGTVRAALARWERHSTPWAGGHDPNSAGNGSLMRLAPVPLFFAADPEQAIAMAADSSRTTHGHPEAGVDAIPGRWRGQLAKLETLESFAARLFEHAAGDADPRRRVRSYRRGSG